jgi:hypothetical protein
MYALTRDGYLFRHLPADRLPIPPGALCEGSGKVPIEETVVRGCREVRDVYGWLR